MKNLKQIDIKGYTIVEDQDNSRFAFSLVGDSSNVILLDEYHAFSEENFFEDLHNAIVKFENVIVRDILYTHIYKMEINGFRLESSGFEDDLLERVRNVIDFSNDDWDVNYLNAGFALAPLFTRDDSSKFTVNEPYYIDLMKNVPMFIVEGEV